MGTGTSSQSSRYGHPCIQRLGFRFGCTGPQPNRLRVHVLVGLSACLLVLAAGPDLEARSRAIQGVATGVGFLGAGEILVEQGSKLLEEEDRHQRQQQQQWWITREEVEGLKSRKQLVWSCLRLSVSCPTPIS